MEKTKSGTTIYEGIAIFGLLCLMVWAAISLGQWGEYTDKYDYAHGYGAHKKVSYEHVQKWVDKHWTGSEANYRHHCECIYKDEEHGYRNVCSYKEFQKYYKATHNRRGVNVKGLDYNEWKKGGAKFLGG